MAQIDSSQIHLWLARLGEITDARRLNECRLLLSEDEREKQARFHFERDRHRYLVTRAMVRTVLSEYVDVPAKDWRYAANDYGKPSIAPELTSARGIEFNVSHTDGLVVLGVTRERAIGVDVENVRSRQVDIGIADRYFAPPEVAALRALPRERQQRGFLEFWTLKESYIKARGMGLSIPLDRFWFELSTGLPVQFVIDAALIDRADRWQIRQLDTGSDYVAAICAERPWSLARRLWR